MNMNKQGPPGFPHLFMHIPRTAGSAIAQVIRSAKPTAQFVQTWRHPTGKWDIAQMRAADRYFGHFKWGIHNMLQRPAPYIVMLREPVDRLVSLYYHQRQSVRDKYHQLAIECDIVGWVAALTDAQDQQVQYLCGRYGKPGRKELERALEHLEQVAVVGIFEELPRSLELYARRLGYLPLPRPTIVKPSKRPTVEELPPKIRRALEACTRGDQILYEAAWRRFQKDYASIRAVSCLSESKWRAPAEPIDAVYLWVDGADPEFSKSMSRYQPEGSGVDAETTGTHRFRDNGELRFSLRSLEIHAPWIRHIYLVTNGQVPDWLDIDNPRLSLVPHETIYPDASHLPTFNSHSIELHLHRIPGLSDRFLYLNDDVFLGRAVTLEDFVTPSGGQRIYLDPWHMPTRRDAGPVHDRAYAHSQWLLDNRYGARVGRKAICHTPHLFDRSRVVQTLQMWRDEVARTSAHRFRDPDDVAFRILYFYSLLEGPQGVARNEVVNGPGAGHYRFVMLSPGDTSLASQLRSIASERPKFFCINDDLPGSDSGAADVIRMQSMAFLYWYFRQPSSLERNAATK